MSELYNRIEQLCKDKGINVSQMCRETGINRSTLSELRVGRSKSLSAKNAQKIAAFFGVPLDYVNPLIVSPADLFVGKNKIAESLLSLEAEPVANDCTYQIPIFESVSAGFGAYTNDSIVGYTPLFITSKSEATETIVIRVRGDSMYPRIEDGALIQVHKQDYADNGNIAVVLIDGETAVVKRYFYDVAAEAVRLESCNPEYPPRIFRGAEIERLKVLGVAKRVITDL